MARVGFDRAPLRL